METFILPRTGQRPIKFKGNLVAEADTKFATGQEQNRWYEIRLYETDDDDYVLQVQYRTQCEGELDLSQVSGPGSITEIECELLCYDPREFLKGYPPDDQFREKRAALERDLKLRFKTAVSELLNAFPEEV